MSHHDKNMEDEPAYVGSTFFDDFDVSDPDTPDAVLDSVTSFNEAQGKDQGGEVRGGHEAPSWNPGGPQERTQSHDKEVWLTESS